jgi:hypothetical protein
MSARDNVTPFPKRPAEEPEEFTEQDAAEVEAETPLSLPRNAPMVCAREFVAHTFEYDGQRTLVFHRSCFYEWSGSHYAEVRRR